MKKTIHARLALAIFLTSVVPNLARTDTDSAQPESRQQPTGALLSITEVFFDGSDEWVELSNFGNSVFTGQLTIKGVKSTDLVLSEIGIPTGASYIRGDTMTQITDKTTIKGSGLGFSISDTNTLNITLFSSGQLLDSFLVDASLVAGLPNNYGFEKIRSGDQRLIVPTSTGRVFNIAGSRIANPGTVRIVTGSNATTGTDQTDQNTGSSFSGTDNVELYTGIVIISEIHPGNDTLPEYLEVQFLSSFSGSLKITGLGAGAATKTITLNALTGQYLVVTDTFMGFVDLYPLLLVDSVSLTDGGESLVITDLSGHELSSVLYTGSVTNYSWYSSSDNAFSQSGFMSPGFSEKALQYLPAISNNSSTQGGSSSTKSEGDTYYQGLYKKRKDRYYDLKSQVSLFGIAINKAGIAYRKGASSAVELVDGSEEFGSAEPLEMASSSTLQISAVLPDATGKDANSEQIRIALLSGSPIDLQDFVININGKKTLLAGALSSPGESLTVKGEFGLVNKPACITLEQRSIVYDTFCYGQPKAGRRITTTGDISDDLAFSGLTDLARMKKVRLSFLTGEACALFGDSPFLCIPTKGIVDPKKQSQFDKKLASLQKKFDKKADQYLALQARHTKTKKELEAKRRKYYEQTKILRASHKEKLSLASLETKLRKSYGSLLQSQIKKDRPAVRQEADIAFLQSLLDTNIKALRTIATGGKSLAIHGNNFAVGDIKKQFAFTTDPAVVLDNLVAQALAFLSSGAAAKRSSRLDQRYAFQE